MNSGPNVLTATTQTPIAQEAVIDPAALARGDAAAVEAFYRELFEPIYAFVFWRVGGVRQDAEDVTQETFVTALAQHRSLRGAFQPLRLGVRHRQEPRPRPAARRAARPDGDPAHESRASVQAAPDHLLERAQTDRLVGLALTELPPHYQRALLDKYVQHRSFAEMAADQRCSAKAVESTVQRAKRALAAALARLGLDDPTENPGVDDHG